MATNRWGVVVLPGRVVTFSTARGETRCGTVRKLTRMSVYGWRVETSAGSCSIHDVIESKHPGLPVRDDVTSVEYHRPPTAGEIKFGHGSIHYRTFDVDECFHPGSRVLKKWFVANDGLRYYR